MGVQACGQKAALETDAQQQQAAIDAQEAAVSRAQVQCVAFDKLHQPFSSLQGHDRLIVLTTRKLAVHQLVCLARCPWKAIITVMMSVVKELHV